MSRNRNVLVSFTKLTSLDIEELLCRRSWVCSCHSRSWVREYFDVRALLWRRCQRWSRHRQDRREENDKDVKFKKQEFCFSSCLERFEREWRRQRQRRWRRKSLLSSASRSFERANDNNVRNQRRFKQSLDCCYEED